MFTGHQDSNMAKVVTCIKSEWHQVERQYGIEIDLQYVRDLFLEHGETEEGCQAIFDKLVSGEMDGGDLEDYGYETYTDFYGMDWDWLDKDDWWTDRKGGYDVTYTQEVIEEEPSTPSDEAKVDKRTESEKSQDDLEPISTNAEFVKTVNEAKEAFKGWADE
jgi:hypothetical protein